MTIATGIRVINGGLEQGLALVRKPAHWNVSTPDEIAVHAGRGQMVKRVLGAAPVTGQVAVAAIC